MISLPNEVKKFIETVQKAGFECYAVGGSVRDLILGRIAKESSRWDFTTSATPEEIQKIFPKSFYDNNYGTVGIKIPLKKKTSLEKKSSSQETEIYEVNGIFRSLLVPQGTHRVIFRYVPMSFYIGAIISCITTGIWVTLWKVKELN